MAVQELRGALREQSPGSTHGLRAAGLVNFRSLPPPTRCLRGSPWAPGAGLPLGKGPAEGRGWAAGQGGQPSSKRAGHWFWRKHAVSTLAGSRGAARCPRSLSPRGLTGAPPGLRPRTQQEHDSGTLREVTPGRGLGRVAKALLGNTAPWVPAPPRAAHPTWAARGVCTRHPCHDASRDREPGAMRTGFWGSLVSEGGSHGIGGAGSGTCRSPPSSPSRGRGPAF